MLMLGTMAWVLYKKTSSLLNELYNNTIYTENIFKFLIDL